MSGETEQQPSGLTVDTLAQMTAKMRDDDRSLARERFGWILGVGAFCWQLIQWRLANLNHENERILKAQSVTVSLDTYEGDEQRRREDQTRLSVSIKELQESVAKSATKEEVQNDTKTGRRATTNNGWVWVAGVAGVLVAAITFYNFAVNHVRSTPPGQTTTVVQTIPSTPTATVVGP